MLMCPRCEDQFIIYSQKVSSGKEYTYRPKMILGPIGTYVVTILDHEIPCTEDELAQMKELVNHIEDAVHWADRKHLFAEWTEGQYAARLISAAHSFSQRQEEDFDPYVAEEEEEDITIWFKEGDY